jgi:hypothetical protein
MSLNKVTQDNRNSVRTSLDNAQPAVGGDVNPIVDAVNTLDARVSSYPLVVAGAIVATNVSQTVDFGTVLVGDKVAMIPATAGNADFITIATAGNLGQAAVVNNLYIVLRSV